MDDEQELTYGNKLVNDAFQNWARGLPPECKKHIAKQKPSLFALRGEFNIFAMCLTEHQTDDAHSESYGDYVLGFDVSETSRQRILKVLYTAEEQASLTQ